jgi:DNA (cytosine-5)-methyltransferase 1
MARDSKGVAADSFGHDSQQLVNTKTKVRRLTPIECERLQGFPDNWTQISWRGKQPKDCPTSHRYRCLGNSMTTNVMRWIGERIAGVPTTIPQKKYYNEPIQAIGCDLYNTSIDTDGKCSSLTTQETPPEVVPALL